jgi:hypothetical protein
MAKLAPLRLSDDRAMHDPSMVLIQVRVVLHLFSRKEEAATDD